VRFEKVLKLEEVAPVEEPLLAGDYAIGTRLRESPTSF